MEVNGQLHISAAYPIMINHNYINCNNLASEWMVCWSIFHLNVKNCFVELDSDSKFLDIFVGREEPVGYYMIFIFCLFDD